MEIIGGDSEEFKKRREKERKRIKKKLNNERKKPRKERVDNPCQIARTRSKKLVISAYPGPDVVKEGRAEHLPYHIHVKGPNLKELRVDIENLVPLDKGRRVPKYLKKHLESNQADYIEMVKDIYHTGKFD